MTVSHNASSVASPLYFNETTALGFQCVYKIPYSVPITYTWSVNGANLNQMSNHLGYYFDNGHYTVTCTASYQIYNCDPCRTTKSVSLVVDGTRLQLVTDNAKISDLTRIIKF